MGEALMEKLLVNIIECVDKLAEDHFDKSDCWTTWETYEIRDN